MLPNSRLISCFFRISGLRFVLRVQALQRGPLRLILGVNSHREGESRLPLFRVRFRQALSCDRSIEHIQQVTVLLLIIWLFIFIKLLLVQTKRLSQRIYLFVCVAVYVADEKRGFVLSLKLVAVKNKLFSSYFLFMEIFGRIVQLGSHAFSHRSVSLIVKYLGPVSWVLTKASFKMGKRLL